MSEIKLLPCPFCGKNPTVRAGWARCTGTDIWSHPLIQMPGFRWNDRAPCRDAVEAEREACAKICDSLAAGHHSDGATVKGAFTAAAAAIRSRYWSIHGDTRRGAGNEG